MSRNTLGVVFVFSLGAAASDIDNARGLLAAGEFQRAAEVAGTAVARYNTRENRHDPELETHLVTLGDAQFALGNHSAALYAFARARQIVRYQHGLKTTQQIPLLNRSADVQLANQNMTAANDLKELVHTLTAQAFGSDDPNATNATITLADWYMTNHHSLAARRAYGRVLLSNNDHIENNPLLKSAVLRKFARTIRTDEFPVSGPTPFLPQPLCCERDTRSAPRQTTTETKRFHTVENALRTAMRLSKVHPDVPGAIQPDEYVQAALDLGDWYFLRGKHRLAAATYADLYNSTGTRLALHLPASLHVPHPGDPRMAGASHRKPKAGLIDITATINAKGKTVGKLQVERAVPEYIDPVKYLHAARRGIYRPALVDNEFQQTEKVTLSFDFIYHD